MRKIWLLIPVVLVIIIVIWLLLAGGAEMPAADDSQTTAQGVTQTVNANNQFALDLFAELKDTNENIFFSPYSISTAFAMAYEGAREKTAEEIQTVMHFPEDDITRRSSFARIHNIINKEGTEYDLYSANCLWLRKDYEFLPEYVNTIENYYLGKATELDFKNEPEKSRKTINDAIEMQTKKKIKGILSPGTIRQDTGLVLTNAIYFKGEWVKQFDKSKTKPMPFRVTHEKTVEVPMMQRTKEADFNYAETDDLQILEMLYKGEDLSMLVLLPKNNSLEGLEDSLTLEKLQEWRAMLQETSIPLYMPKFRFEDKYSLNDNLKNMGINDAFDLLKANFAGIDGISQLYITDVIHQSYIDVYEEGTEAAAATSILMGLKAAMPVREFRADHPFIFVIQERKTGNILFFGRMINPTENKGF